jgi:2-oxoglutarate ferredoxin oxidoreductase subunit gamma
MVTEGFKLMIAGLGGQGALFAGRLLAEAAMSHYKSVLFFPNYGAAMRGGESECTIILSHQEIDSPIVMNPQALILMGSAPLAKFQHRLKPQGLMIVDSTLVSTPVNRQDIEVLYIPATQKAKELGDRQVANLILLGACLKATQALPIEEVEAILERKLKGDSAKSLFKLNKAALWEGARIVANLKGG